MTFGSRLKQLREENGFDKIKDFVESFNAKYPDTKLSMPVVSRYENGVHTPKRFTIVENMAEFFGVNINYMSGKSNDKYGEDVVYREIPILGTIAAGIPILAQEDIQGHEYIKPDIDIDFCLKVKGDSMINARIFDGDIVFIKSQPEVENGQIAAVIIDGEEATLKRVYCNENSLMLRPENPLYKEIIFTKKDKKNITILGRAVYFKSEVR